MAVGRDEWSLGGERWRIVFSPIVVEATAQPASADEAMPVPAPPGADRTGAPTRRVTTDQRPRRALDADLLRSSRAHADRQRGDVGRRALAHRRRRPCSAVLGRSRRRSVPSNADRSSTPGAAVGHRRADGDHGRSRATADGHPTRPRLVRRRRRAYLRPAAHELLGRRARASPRVAAGRQLDRHHRTPARRSAVRRAPPPSAARRSFGPDPSPSNLGPLDSRRTAIEGAAADRAASAKEEGLVETMVSRYSKSGGDARSPSFPSASYAAYL